jgi:hypothetical protein
VAAGQLTSARFHGPVEPVKVVDGAGAGILDQHVQATEFTVDCREQGLDARAICHIGRDGAMPGRARPK